MSPLTSHVMVAIATYILGLLSRSIAPPIVDRLQLMIVALVVARGWKIGRRSRLGGNWNHVWYATESKTWPDANPCFVSMSAIGRHAAGFYLYNGKYWLITASVDDDRVIMGSWKEAGAKGYRGNWLGKLDLNGSTITGWYCGTSNRGPHGVGEWVWWRENTLPPDLPTPIIQPAKVRRFGESLTGDGL